jgi:hypothetical protein
MNFPLQLMLRRFRSAVVGKNCSSRRGRPPRPTPKLEALEDRVLLTLSSPPDQLLPTVYRPIDVQLGPIDGDRLPDVAVLGAKGRLTTALNNGANGWSQVRKVDLHVGPANGMVLGAFDSAHSYAGLVVQGPDYLTVFRGDGTGHFAWSQTLTPDSPGQLAPSGSRHVQMAAARLNGDDFLDLVTVSPGTNEVLVYFGLGDGTFTGPARYASGAGQPDAVLAGDFIGDTLPDLAVGHQDGSVTFFEGLAGGAFGARPDLTVPGLGTVVGLAAGNLDGDGGSEIAVSGTSGVTLLNNHHRPPGPVIGNGDFGAGLAGWVVRGPVTTAGGAAQFQTGAGLLTSLRQTFTVPALPQTLAFDLPSLDLQGAAGGVPGAFEVSLLDADNNSVVPTFRPEATSFLNLNAGGSAATAPGVTFDGQHVSVDVSGLAPGTTVTLSFDLIGGASGSNSSATVANVQLTQLPPAETFTATPLAGPFGATAGVAVADVNGDGHADVVVADTGLDQLLVFNGDGAGNLSRSTLDLAPFGQGASALAVAPLVAGEAGADVAVALTGSSAVLTPLLADPQPPRVELSLTPDVLWPVNNQFVKVRANVDVHDNLDPHPTVTLLSITSNDPAGDAQNIQGAAFGTDDRKFKLRAARLANDAPRIYTVTYFVRDAASNGRVVAANVVVPQDGPASGEALLDALGDPTPPGLGSLETASVSQIQNGSFSVGDLVSSSIAQAGEVDVWAFQGSAGQRLFFNAVSGNADFLHWFVTAPDGQVLFSTRFADHDTLALPAAGTYYLTVDAHANQTGAYQFEAWNVPADVPQAITPGSLVSGNLTVPGQTQTYTVQGQLGQQLLFHLVSDPGGVRFTLTDPSGQILFAGVTADRLVGPLSAAGTYTLVARTPGAQTGSYQFQVVDPATVVPPQHTLPPAPVATEPLGPFDFGRLQDVTPLGQLTFAGTTFNQHTGTLYASVTLTNTGPVPLGGPILAVFAGFNPPAVSLNNPDDFLPDGRPFVAFDEEFSGVSLLPGQTSQPVQLALADASQVPVNPVVTLLAPADRSPAFTSAPATQVLFGGSYQYAAQATDPDGDPLTYRLTQAPAGMTLDAVTGLISWTPDATQLGNHDVTLTVTDGRGGVATQTFVLQVLPGAGVHPPILLAPPAPLSALAGQPFRYPVAAMDPGNAPLTFTLAAAPAGMTIDSATGLISWTPAATGLAAVTVLATDALGGFASQTLTVNVVNGPAAVLTGNVFNDLNGDGVQDNTFSGQTATYDPFAQFSAVNNPAGAWTYAYETALGLESSFTLDHPVNPVPAGLEAWTGGVSADNTPLVARNFTANVIQLGTVIWVPGEILLHPGPHGELSVLRFTAPAAGVYTLTATFAARDLFPGGTDVHVLLNNVSLFAGATSNLGGASFTSAPLTLQEGDRIDFVVGFGANGNYFNDATGLVATITQGPRTIPEPGLANWTVYLDTNGNGRQDTGEPVAVTEAQGNYTLSNLAPGTYTVAEQRQASWLPTAPPGGSVAVTVAAGQTVSGPHFGNQGAPATPGGPPAFTTTPPTAATVGQLYRYQAAATDPNGDPVQYTLVSGPAGMVVDPVSGLVVWMPDTDEVGSQPVVLRASDSTGSTQQTFNVSVSPAGAGLVLTSTPPILATEGVSFAYTPTASGLVQAFSLAAGPAGMTIDPATGTLSWTPGAADLGNHLVSIRAEGALGLVAYQTFEVEVRGPNVPPQITSSPNLSVTAGTIYRYRVAAVDAGDAVRYSLVSGPAGMLIDPVSGLLLWQAGAVGAVSVTVRAADERGAFADQTFTLNVTPDTQPPAVGVLLSSDAVQPGQAVTVKVVTFDNVGIAGLGLTVNGVGLTLDATGTAVFTPLDAGLLLLEATATDTSGNVGTASATLRVNVL